MKSLIELILQTLIIYVFMIFYIEVVELEPIYALLLAAMPVFLNSMIEIKNK